jgi:uncharacterized membrane protein
MDHPVANKLREAEWNLLKDLRRARQELRAASAGAPGSTQLTLGQRIADGVAAIMGSWNFIIAQSTVLLLWIILNITAFIEHWDPYPFILLNLALSFQAAYAAPFIMMSQNRQQDVDRRAAETDYQINIKAELEIESLHQKLDELRETEVLDLTKAVRELTELLNRSGLCAPAQSGATPSPDIDAG